MTPPDREVVVDLKNLCKQFGSVQAVKPLTLRFYRGEFIAILGPSGCGKTTLLRMIGGFLDPTSGSIVIAGKDVLGTGPDRRPTNMVFQGYGLFPHMTVVQNIAYGLRVARVGKEEAQKRVRDAIELVRLEGLEARSISELSGGQQQRVALARALIMRPAVLLLDEPLAALDLKLRKAMQNELRRVHQSTGGTFVFVTHDQEEAMALATRIFVMEAGHVVQEGRPEDIYTSPNSAFVSTFIGDANVLRGDRKNGEIRLVSRLSFPDPGLDQAVLCVVRPENVTIAPTAADPETARLDFRLTGTLLDAVFLGPSIKYTVQLEGGETLVSDSRNMEMRKRLTVGKNVIVGWARADQRVLPGP